MNKRSSVGLSAAKFLRFLFVFTLLVLAGRSSSASGQTVTNLWSFIAGSNGGNPWAGLVQGSDGNFYGTTRSGGTNGEGTVFRINSAGTLATLYQFGFGTNGYNPMAGLVQGSDGDFYGTTHSGGAYEGGTVFRISSAGTLTTLYQFGGLPTDGQNIWAGLVQGSDGNFYGTTALGGTNSAGTVFQVSSAGTLTTLWQFSGYPADGAYPYAGLVQSSDGNFYGTTVNGGTSTNCVSGCGTVFRISPGGSYSNFYSFSSDPAGKDPQAALVQGSDGYFYGTTYLGGTYGSGTVYKLSVPSNPPPYPINQITSLQLSSTNAIFNVVSIAGETYQLQFSSSMNPTNWVNVPNVSVTNSIGALLTVTNFGGAVGPQGFYRFAITP